MCIRDRNSGGTNLEKDVDILEVTNKDSNKLMNAKTIFENGETFTGSILCIEPTRRCDTGYFLFSFVTR